MKKIHIIFWFLILCYSCNNAERTDIKKEVFEFVLKDRVKLDSTVQIIHESKDTIDIFDMTLIENSFIDIKLDTVNNEVSIFSRNTPPLSHPFFKGSMDFITNQIENLEVSLWDTTTLNIDIEIDYPLKEYDDTIKGKTALWLANNRDKTFLLISEPIYNTDGEVMVSAYITSRDYIIDKSYVLRKIKQKWEIHDYSTIVCKYSEPEIEKIINNRGEEITETTLYHIVVGYYDI